MKIEKEELLKEVLGGDDLSAIRERALARGLDALRRRTNRRRQFQAAIILAPLLVLVLHWHVHPALQVAPEPVPASAPVEETGKVKYITEKELFALFPNRPVALIGEPGHQQFLLLDEMNGAKRDN